MLDIFLNAAKLAFSEDARKSVSSLVEFIRRTPEWQNDICELEARIDAAHEEYAVLLLDLAASKMKNIKFPDRVISDFRVSSIELIRNAFENGCIRGQAITLTISVSPSFVSIKVENARGRELDLKQLLHTCRARLRENPSRRRGRGLLMVEEVADSFEQIGDRAVKAVFYESTVEFEILRNQDPLIVKVVKGFYNPSINRRIINLVSSALPETSVVLDVADLMGTETVEIAIDLHAIGKTFGKSFIIKVSPYKNHVGDLIRNAGCTVVTTWTEVEKTLACKL